MFRGGIVQWQRMAKLLPLARIGHAHRPVCSSSTTHNVTSRPRKGDVLELVCTDVAFGGDGICKLEGGFVVFCPAALPGERITAVIKTSKSSYARAEKISTLQKHSHWIEPPCPYFGPCGGCTYQSLEYSAQLATKEKQVLDLLQRVGGVTPTNLSSAMRPIVPGELQYQYRNKMEFSFSPEGDSFALGLHRPGSHHTVLPLATCLLQTTAANEILAIAGNACKAAGLTADAGDRVRTAVLQHLVIRHSVAQDKYLVNIVTSRDARTLLAPVARALMEHPLVQGVVNSVTAKGRAVEERLIEKEYVLSGTGYLIERLGGLEFEFSSSSFFQTNTAQAERLFSLVKEAAAVQPNDIVCDLFCGSGTFTLLLAQHCRQAWGIELSSAAVADAERNAKRNNISNATFLCGDVERLLPDIGSTVPAPDVVVVDPARQGLAGAAVNFLLACGAKRVIYVSCNPASQARDIRALCSEQDKDSGIDSFRLVSVQPVDLYPQTTHVETVAVLERGRGTTEQ